MCYEYTIKLNSNDRFNSSMNFIRKSKTFYFDVIFTILAIFATIYMIISRKFFTLGTARKILMMICCIIFPIIQPIMLYIKSIMNKSKFVESEITLKFDDEKIYISSSAEKTTFDYADVYNFIKFENMIVLMYDSIHGQIIPDRYTKDEKEDFFNFVSDKIKVAREKVKNEKNN